MRALNFHVTAQIYMMRFSLCNTVILTALTQLMSEHVLYHSSVPLLASFNHPQVPRTTMLTFFREAKTKDSKLWYMEGRIFAKYYCHCIVCKVKKSLAFMCETNNVASFLFGWKLGKTTVVYIVCLLVKMRIRKEKKGAHHLRCKCKIYAHAHD